MHPIFIQIGNFSIRWYGVMAALGFAAAMLVLMSLRKLAGMTKDQTVNLVTVAIISGVLGARVFYVIECWDRYHNDLMEILRIDHGGLVFYGGFICAMTSFIFFCRSNKLDAVRVLDISGPALFLGHMFGRIGCFLNGCCFGSPTRCPWAVTFPADSIPALHYGSLALHPVQLYEAGSNFILFIVLYMLLPKLRRGQGFSLYLIAYGLLRLVDEFFRGDNKIIMFDTFTISQVISIFLIIPLGVICFVYFTRGGSGDAADQNQRGA